MRSEPVLPVMLAACATATLFHHAHNADFLDEYPNMPAWLSPSGVYAAWLVTTVTGLGGYVLVRRGYRLVGQVLLIAYGCYALGGLAHYALAPLSAHTAVMNLSIWLEAATAIGLIACSISPGRE